MFDLLLRAYSWEKLVRERNSQGKGNDPREVHSHMKFCQGLMDKEGFPHGSDSKESVCNAGELGRSLGWEDSPAGSHGNPLQYSCLENSIYRGAWWAIVYGVAKS